MNPYSSGLPRYDDDNGQLRQRSRRTGNSLIRDFLAKPIPLPTWLWNVIVIYLVISAVWFLTKIGYMILIGLAFLLDAVF